MQSGNIKSVIKFLNRKRSLKSLYFDFLSKLSGINFEVRNLKFYVFPLNINDFTVISRSRLKIREFNPLFVLIRKKDIDCQIKINQNPEFFKVNLSNINYLQPIYSQVRWRNPDLGLNTVYRNYPIEIFAKIKSYERDKLILNNKIKIHAVDRDKIELERRLKVIEEIIGISPYVRRIERKRLYGVPIIKDPVYKSHFNQEQMEKFREELARQAKTRVRNVEISHIYNKLNIDIYSAIRQDPVSKSLICQPKFDLFKNNVYKLYYLIVGNRKDNRVTIKALVPMEE